jgi:hypothetical protein
MIVETNPVFLDPAHPGGDHVQDLLLRMTIDENISQVRSTAAALITQPCARAAGT